MVIGLQNEPGPSNIGLLGIHQLLIPPHLVEVLPSPKYGQFQASAATAEQPTEQDIKQATGVFTNVPASGQSSKLPNELKY